MAFIASPLSCRDAVLVADPWSSSARGHDCRRAQCDKSNEGSGDNAFSPATNTYNAAAASTTAGLQKWVFDGTAWKLAYTIQNGLNLGVPYSVANDAKGNSYPTGNNTYVDSNGKA